MLSGVFGLHWREGGEVRQGWKEGGREVRQAGRGGRREGNKKTLQQALALLRKICNVHNVK